MRRDTLASGGHLLVGEATVLGLPLGDGGQPIASQERPPRCPRHPGRDTHALGGSGGTDTIVDVGVDGDRKLG